MKNKQLARRLRRIASRGVTLIEILIVLAIIGLIAGGITAVAIPRLNESRLKSTKIDCQNLQQVAERYRSDHAGEECPTAQLLKDKKEISASSNIKDPWDHGYVIECEADETYVRSWGPDGKAGTQDDIMIPEKKGE